MEETTANVLTKMFKQRNVSQTKKTIITITISGRNRPHKKILHFSRKKMSSFICLDFSYFFFNLFTLHFLTVSTLLDLTVLLKKIGKNGLFYVLKDTSTVCYFIQIIADLQFFISKKFFDIFYRSCRCCKYKVNLNTTDCL